MYILGTGGRAIGKGIHFHDFGIRNGIDFHDFGIRNGINLGQANSVLLLWFFMILGDFHNCKFPKF